MNILVTGGCGFIGSNFIKYLLASSEINKDIIINLDKQTYAGRGKNLEHMGLDKIDEYRFVRGDICDKNLVDKIFSLYGPEIVFNFAAESHVDRSIENAEDFVKTNFEGVANLLDAAIKYKVKRFVQVSTDEVYGSINYQSCIKHGSFREGANLNPTSPYASSKAAADLMALSYFKTHNMPVLITRSANNYGPYQFPEKLLPLFITNLIEGRKIPLMYSKENPGLNVRDWLHVEDNCRAIWLISQNGKEGLVYNIPGTNEIQNIELTELLLKKFGYGLDMIEKIPHRKGHDFRYSMVGERLERLGFEYKHKDFRGEVDNLIEWYKQNKEWWGPLKK